jgi:hypothetical protein
MNGLEWGVEAKANAILPKGIDVGAGTGGMHRSANGLLLADESAQHYAVVRRLCRLGRVRVVGV